MDPAARRASGIGFIDTLQDGLCEQLADLAQQCIAGFSDDRPVSASLVRSRLTNALTGAPPVLTVARDDGGVTGWCAVRRPEPGEARARLWGPVVAPEARRAGLGTRLLDAVVGATQWPLMTTDVPADRHGAADFFAQSGWTKLDSVTVLHGTPVQGGFEAATADTVPELEAYVTAAARRHARHEAAFAEAALRRWQDDARYRPGNLLLDTSTGSLLLALAQRTTVSSELLLAEVWAADVRARRRLITAAHTLAAEQQLDTVRAVTRLEPADFVACGMHITGRCSTFTLPGER